jgi:hypothetical protein
MVHLFERFSRGSSPSRERSERYNVARSEAPIPSKGIAVFFNGRKIALEAGRFAGAALLSAAGKKENLPGPGDPPYLFCGNGACRDCNLHVDGIDDVQSCKLPVSRGMSFRPGEGAGEENALSRNLRGLEGEEKSPLDVDLAIVGAGVAGSAARDAARAMGVEAELFDTRGDRDAPPRPASVRDGRLAIAVEGAIRIVRARALILATGANARGEPAILLAKALGCRTRYDSTVGYERLILDGDGRTSIPRIFAAEDAGMGRRAGQAASASLGKPS